MAVLLEVTQVRLLFDFIDFQNIPCSPYIAGELSVERTHSKISEVVLGM